MLHLGTFKSADLANLDTIHEITHKAEDACKPFYPDMEHPVLAPWHLTEFHKGNPDATFNSRVLLSEVMELLPCRIWEVDYNPIDNAFYLNGDFEKSSYEC